MTITRENESVWTDEDALKWQTFLGTQTGTRLLPKLVEAAPALLRGGPTNEILIRTGELGGFQEAVRALLLIASPTPLPPTPETHYPDLDDDDKWNDGQKLS